MESLEKNYIEKKPETLETNLSSSKDNTFVNKFETTEDRIERKRKEKEEIDVLRAELGIDPIQNESLEEDTRKHMEMSRDSMMIDVVERVQDIYIKAAEQYLPEESLIRKQMIKFYSDPGRLYEELSHVFKDTKKEEIEKLLNETERNLQDKKYFVENVLSKDFSTAH